MRWLGLGALLLLWSCEGARPSVHVPWPGGAGDRAALIALYSNPVTVVAADLGAPTERLDFQIPAQSDGALQAITFDKPLSSLRLLPGPQNPGPEGSPKPMELNAVAAAWSLVLEDEQARWAAKDRGEIGDELRDFRLQVDLRPCSNFGPAHWSETHERERTSFAIGVGAAGWVGASEFDASGDLRLSERLYEAGPAGLRTIDSPLPFTWPSAALRDGDNLYLGAVDGSVWRLDTKRLDLPPAQVRVPGGDRVTAMSGGRTPDGRFELVTLSRSGETQFLGSNGRWSPPLESPVSKINEVGWAEPGLAYVRSAMPGSVLAVRPDGHEEQPSGGNGQVMSLAFLPNLGRLYAGTDDGSLFSRDPNTGWRAVDASPNFGWWVIGLEPYGDGLFLLLASGSVAEFHPGQGVCEDSSVLKFLGSGDLATLDDGSLLVVGSDFPFAYFALLPRVP